MAAVFVLLAGFALAFRGTQENGAVSTVASDPELETQTSAPSVSGVPGPTAISVGEAFCRGPFAELVTGIQAWRGVDGWSRLTDQRNPEPHLPELAVDALTALAPLVDSDNAIAQRNAMAGVLEQSVGASSQSRVARTETLLDVVDLLHVEISADLATGSLRLLDCNLDELSAAARPVD